MNRHFMRQAKVLFLNEQLGSIGPLIRSKGSISGCVPPVDVPETIFYDTND